MSKGLIAALSTIVVAAVLLATYAPNNEVVVTENSPLEMPAIFTTDCTQALVVECAVDI